MRYTVSEKLQIIQRVEQSSLPVRRTLRQLGIRKSTFYGWYRRYVEGALEALEDQPPRPSRVWNKVPEEAVEAILELALAEPALSPRELAVKLHRHRPILCVRIHRLPVTQGPGSDHKPRLHRGAGVGQVQPSNDARE